MSENARAVIARRLHEPVAVPDDAFTICAISAVSAMLANVLHEGVGHGLIALASGAHSGVLNTVAWSSAFDSRLVEAGGTLVNLLAGLVFWITLRRARGASLPARYFLLTSCALNLFTGTGYFFFSGVSDFGDWAQVIAGLHPHGLWRALLVIFGIAGYYGAVRMVGAGLVHNIGVPLDQHRRWRRLTLLPYVTAIVLLGVAGLRNQLGIQYVWLSALPASAGADSGLLWMRYYLPTRTVPDRAAEALPRSYAWLALAAVLIFAYIFVLGRGVTLYAYSHSAAR